jgi:hypothetical protein
MSKARIGIAFLPCAMRPKPQGACKDLLRLGRECSRKKPGVHCARFFLPMARGLPQGMDAPSLPAYKEPLAERAAARPQRQPFLCAIIKASA